MTRIYLAGPSSELDRVRHWASKLDGYGQFEITHRWWLNFDTHEVGKDHELHPATRRRLARECMLGVSQAHIVWALWPEQHSDGVPFELGYSLGKAEWVVASGGRSAGSVFPSIVDYLSTDEDAFVDCVRVARAAKLAWLAQLGEV